MESPSNLVLVPGYTRADDPRVTAVVVLAGVSSVTPAALGVAVFLRRRARSHLFVVLALLVFMSRATVVALTLGGAFSEFDHYVAEHLLDLAMAGLTLMTIYYVRSIECEAGVDDP